MTAVIQVDHLSKAYRTGVRRKRVLAVDDVSFQVDKGETYGFLGPNGAGKTTTIRVLMGLISPTAGECRVFGQPIHERSARARLGFLPEAPYFYDYLSVSELLDLTGRLFGLPRGERIDRADELISRVGLDHARNMAMKKYSKGMLQRAGIAQALVNDPELVVLDEPMSGLDPVGRKEIRDLILGLRDAGKTVFFSTHILSDVEAVCDRVAIIVRGKIHDVGRLGELVHSDILRTDVLLRIADDLSDDAVAELEQVAENLRRIEREIHLSLPPDADIDDFLARARALGCKTVSVTPHHETLEDLFIRTAYAAGRPADRPDRGSA